MGRYGFRSGYVNSVNIKEGEVTFDADDESKSVSFDDPLREDAVPKVVLLPQSEASEDVWKSEASAEGFTVDRSDTGTEVTYDFIAIDQE